MSTDFVSQLEQTAEPADCLRLEPEHRLVPDFDAESLACFPVASPEQMGFLVLDDCCREHIM